LEAAVKADEASIENTQVQLDYAAVTAPIEGMTGIRMVDVGNVISPSDPGIVVITQIKPIAVIFTLPCGYGRGDDARPSRRNGPG
jgi:multidrug efflux system membrane fusion protein